MRHPIYTNYEASKDGVIRNCRLKKPVGNIDNTGYFRFNIGRKRYLSHKFIFECFHGIVKDGLVVDHKDGCPRHNSVNNLQAITQSQNCRRGNTGRCKVFGKKTIKSINAETEIIFPSINTAARYFDIYPQSVQNFANKTYKSAYSIKYNQRIIFEYV